MRSKTPARLPQALGLLSLALLVLTLVGCSAGWKAPLETRGSHPRQARDTATPRIRSRTYKVQRGDTLYAIAWRAGRDFRSLARLNRIPPPYTIYPGQLLILTPSSHAARSSSTSTAPVNARAKNESTARRSPAPPKQTAKRDDDSGPADSALHWTWPVRGPVLVKFSANDSTQTGIKIGGRLGQAVHATEAGKVVYSGSGLIGYGQLIIIKHNDNYLSAYGHNAKLLVKEGDQVARGRHIADMGRSNDGKAMLHFEIRREGKPVDPLALLPK